MTATNHNKSPFKDFCVLLTKSESYFTKFAQSSYFTTRVRSPPHCQCCRMTVILLFPQSGRKTRLFFSLVQIGNSAQYQSELEVKFELICLTPVSNIYYGLVAGQDKKPELQQWQHRCTLRPAEMGDDHFHSSSLCLDLAVP